MPHPDLVTAWNHFTYKIGNSPLRAHPSLSLVFAPTPTATGFILSRNLSADPFFSQVPQSSLSALPSWHCIYIPWSLISLTFSSVPSNALSLPSSEHTLGQTPTLEKTYYLLLLWLSVESLQIGCHLWYQQSCFSSQLALLFLAETIRTSSTFLRPSTDSVPLRKWPLLLQWDSWDSERDFLQFLTTKTKPVFSFSALDDRKKDIS